MVVQHQNQQRMVHGPTPLATFSYCGKGLLTCRLDGKMMQKFDLVGVIGGVSDQADNDADIPRILEQSASPSD